MATGLVHEFWVGGSNVRQLPPTPTSVVTGDERVGGFSCTQEVDGGFTAATGQITAAELAAHPTVYVMGTTWLVKDRQSGEYVFGGELKDPASSAGVVTLSADGWGKRADASIPRALFESENVQQWQTGDQAPFGLIPGPASQGGLGDATKADNRIPLDVRGSQLIFDVHRYTSFPRRAGNTIPATWASVPFVFWAPQADINRLVFTLHKSTNDADYQLELIGKTVGPDLTTGLTVINTWSLGGGGPANHSTVDYAIGSTYDIIGLRVRRIGNKVIKARPRRWRLEDVRVGGIATSSPYTLNDAFTYISGVLGVSGGNKDIAASSVNMTPYDASNAGWGQIMDDISILDNWSWQFTANASTGAKAFRAGAIGRYQWKVTETHQPVRLIPQARYNKVSYEYFYGGGYTAVGTVTASPNPFPGGYDQTFRLQMEEPPIQVLAAAFAQKIANYLSVYHQTGSATISEVEDPAAPGVRVPVGKVRPGDKLTLANYANLDVFVSSVRLSEDGTYADIDFTSGNPLVDKLLARRQRLLNMGIDANKATLRLLDPDIPAAPNISNIAFYREEMRNGERHYNMVIDWDEVDTDINGDATAVDEYVVRIRPVLSRAPSWSPLPGTTPTYDSGANKWVMSPTWQGIRSPLFEVSSQADGTLSADIFTTTTSNEPTFAPEGGLLWGSEYFMADGVTPALNSISYTGNGNAQQVTKNVLTNKSWNTPFGNQVVYVRFNITADPYYVNPGAGTFEVSNIKVTFPDGSEAPAVSDGGGWRKKTIKEPETDDADLLIDTPTRTTFRNLAHPHRWFYEAQVQAIDLLGQRGAWSPLSLPIKPDTFVPADPDNFELWSTPHRVHGTWDAPKDPDDDGPPPNWKPDVKGFQVQLSKDTSGGTRFNDATNEVQTITMTGFGSGDSFKLTHGSHETSAITFAARSADDVLSALTGLTEFTKADLKVTGPAGGPYVVTFHGAYTNTNVTALSVTSSVGCSGSVVETTAGSVNGVFKTLRTESESFAVHVHKTLGVVWYGRIRSYDAYGNKGNWVTSDNSDQLPDVPGNLSIDYQANTKLAHHKIDMKMKWDEVNWVFGDIDEYVVERQQTLPADTTFVGGSVETKRWKVDAANDTDPGLYAHRIVRADRRYIYRFRVRAVGRHRVKGDWSGYFPSVGGSNPRDDTPPPSPLNVELYDKGTDRVIVEWEHQTIDIPTRGTVAGTSGSPTVTGTGTLFTVEVGIGTSIKVDSNTYLVKHITSDTSITLATNLSTTPTTSTMYLIDRDPEVAFYEVQIAKSADVNTGTTPDQWSAVYKKDQLRGQRKGFKVKDADANATFFARVRSVDAAYNKSPWIPAWFRDLHSGAANSAANVDGDGVTIGKGGGGSMVATFTKIGRLRTKHYANRRWTNTTNVRLYFKKARATVGDRETNTGAPTGSAVKIQLKRWLYSASTNTESTPQSVFQLGGGADDDDRLIINAGTYKDLNGPGSFEIAYLEPDEALTVKVAQVGSGFPGEDLTVQVWMEP